MPPPGRQVKVCPVPHTISPARRLREEHRGPEARASPNTSHNMAATTDPTEILISQSHQPKQLSFLLIFFLILSLPRFLSCFLSYFLYLVYFISNGMFFLCPFPPSLPPSRLPSVLPYLFLAILIPFLPFLPFSIHSSLSLSLYKSFPDSVFFPSTI